ncbi:Crp/Fnr family transcriptional regulator [Flavobacterium silvaticum]|uniref:Crp/Fnr family transcriptional regulator n=1 Tax=Flavobacterium silvaticum TaxID=1852020 RepID=A0A972FZW3_9FLAO|nr:Crp/Fnr family transcriptional regulator [Flavobacterium silvaticum]NMH27846.1 Crp/Fnr family transcriptional regulator [Flavobacterium silvaticum]
MASQLLIDFIEKNIPNITVSKSALESIAGLFEETDFDKNEFLLKQGKVSDYYYLASGFVRAYTFDTDGNEITTYFYAKDHVIFEAASFFLHVPSAEYIQAITPCKVFTITFEKLNTLFHDVPEFREFARAMLVREFVAYKQRTLAMINKSAEERYANLMAANKEIFQYAQLKHIASYLGITDTSLSRIRKEFARK